MQLLSFFEVTVKNNFDFFSDKRSQIPINLNFASLLPGSKTVSFGVKANLESSKRYVTLALKTVSKPERRDKGLPHKAHSHGIIGLRINNDKGAVGRVLLKFIGVHGIGRTQFDIGNGV